MASTEFPQVHRRPTKNRLRNAPRDSSIIRASVLETALELGFGQNSTVADWIFNNPLSEEVEESHPEPDIQRKLDAKSDPVPELVEATTPSSNSVSDESSSLNSPANVAPSAAATAIQVHTHKPSLTESPHVHFGDFSPDQLQLFSPFTLSPPEVHHGDTGGNPVTPPRANERSRSQDDNLRRNPRRDNPSPGSADTGYASEGQYLSKGNAKKGNSKPGKSRGSKESGSKVRDNNKASEKDVEYASDGGYISASSNKSQGKSSGRVKARAMAFFRRRPKKSASDDEDEDNIPPVPALPNIPRPSSPKPLEPRVAPSSPTRSGFSPLTLNLTNPPVSPPRQQASKSPPRVPSRTASPQQSDRQRPISPPVVAAPAPAVQTSAAAAAAAFPLPPSMPGTPLLTPSCPPVSLPLASAGGTGSVTKSFITTSSRQHLAIPPPAPPPTFPLPQLPPSPSTSMPPPLTVTPTTPSRRGAPTRPIPGVPTSPGPTQPLFSRRTASPLRPLLSPRTSPHAMSNGPESDPLNGKDPVRRQRSGTTLSAGFGNTPAFLQRRIQHGPPPSPRLPPPDAPLPPSPGPTSGTRPRTPMGSPSKFHEHFSSISSMPLAQVLPTSSSMSPSPSTSTLSGSSSGPSVRSSHISSVSGRSEVPTTHDSLSVPDYFHPTTRASIASESSYSKPVVPLRRPMTDHRSRFSGPSDVSSSIYASTVPRHSNVTGYDADADADVEDAVPKSCVDEGDDDASVYTSDDKTAGRRTMYLMEHGELDENGDEVVVNGSRYWDGHDAPPLPPFPPMPIQPGPGYF